MTVRDGSPFPYREGAPGRARGEKFAMAVAGLIFGVLGMALALFPVFLLLKFPLNLLFAAPALLGAVFSGVGLVTARGTGRGKWVAVPGLALSGCAGVWIVLVVVTGSVLQGQGTSGLEWLHGATAVQPAGDGDTEPAPPAQQEETPAPAETSGETPEQPSLLVTGPELDELTTRVASLKNSAAHLGAEETWRRITRLRERTDALSADYDVGTIPEELDALVVAALELEVARLAAEARAALKREAFDAAQELCQRALTLHTSDAVPPLSTGASPAPPDTEDARDVLERGRMYRDPGNRFRITRVLKGPKGAVVSIDDHLTDASYDVEEGQRFGRFKLVGVNASEGSATIQRGDKAFTIYQ